ncbi:FAD:protein FMN transferase [Shewanella youngdeokensis]|uniref:FAD:protein FMN transferase n=1 Tax=Shewanella youngdeokensis TaxID=2999068 RepID=A0ABZ0K083_9GAMM|nr:FAD:protein FMN transferase [Shewanella sp. DAU334]
MFKALVNWLALIGLAFFISACSKPAEIISLSGQTMGTTYHIKVVKSAMLPDAITLQAEIDLALEQVNDAMSTYRPQSELSRFNAAAVDTPLTVSDDVAKVVKAGLDLYQKTGGALDITIGPLVNLWGFGPDKKPITVPSENDIKAAKTLTGLASLTLEGNQLSKSNAGLYVDLSAIAKGFGVDKVAAVLDQYQPIGYLVEVGGEISLHGTKGDGSLWRVAIEKPNELSRAVQQVISPKNIGMATSGDYRIYHEEDGKRFSHLIDPRTGFPIDHRLASVTVLHPQSMIADGYATAMMVLGTQASLELANREQLAIMLIEKQDDGFKVFYSDAFKPYVAP